MVDEKNILRFLYEAKGKTVSGTSLSGNLRVSRTAVWKHIKILKEKGVGIESGPKGYCLLNPEDLLFPFCFDEKYEKRIFHFQEVETTMDTAKFLAQKEAPHLSVVIAENQTAGRGRLNRKWSSPRGGLWFTLILKPLIPPVLSYIYNFAASLSLSKSLKKSAGIDVRIKWPNDLLLKGRKLAGLLSEIETRGDMINFLNIGIGINVNNNPLKNAISLKEVLNKKISRSFILESFLDEFENRTENIDCKKIIDQWKKHTSTIGTDVTIETPGKIYKGTALDVDETGALLIRDKKNRIKKIIYGDCFHNP